MCSDADNAVVAIPANITPNVIFGSGNAEGSFTVDTFPGSIETGLSAKLRCDENGAPPNSFNSDTHGFYLNGKDLPASLPLLLGGSGQIAAVWRKRR
ncbi:MAG: VPLPA-CTERM sorting domain-containing protein [Pseudomonadota bacterium]